SVTSGTLVRRTDRCPRQWRGAAVVPSPSPAARSPPTGRGPGADPLRLRAAPGRPAGSWRDRVGLGAVRRGGRARQGPSGADGLAGPLLVLGADAHQQGP